MDVYSVTQKQSVELGSGSKVECLFSVNKALDSSPGPQQLKANRNFKIKNKDLWLKKYTD